MVRILVATSIREAAVTATTSATVALGGSNSEASEISDHCDDNQSLMRLVLASDRARTATFAAPSLGLCFVGVGYDGIFGQGPSM